jgi:uncharacterized protein YgbK (DUF1537 family)
VVAARFDVVVVCAGGRHLAARLAGARVAQVIRAGWPVRLVSNRVDSTLRGNLGASTAAALRTVADESGLRAVALCAPAHPTAGRHTVDGTQLLDGVRLEETELAHDPRTPIRHSHVASVLREQAELDIAHLPLSAVTGDRDRLRNLIRERLAGGAEVIVADALTVDHLDRVSRAAVEAATDSMIWVSVDSGPSSVALATALGITGQHGGGPILAVSGSATNLTRAQLARLRSERDVTTVRAVPSGQSPVPDVDATAAALDRALAHSTAGDIVLLATVLDEADVVAIEPHQAELLPQAMARTVRRALEQHAVDGLFATGGDISAALFTELAAHGLDVELELEPLAVAGTFIGGPWAGLPVVTKGGLVGTAQTVVACVDHLQRTAAATRRHVRTASSRVSSATPIRRST